MLAPLQYTERSRRRAVLLGVAAVAVVGALLALVLTRGPVATVLLSPGPPYPLEGGIGDRAESLPQQDGPHDGQEWTPWTLLAVSSDGRGLTVGWTNAGTSACTGPPVAAHVEQDAHVVRIGLITRSGTDRLCADVGYSRVYRIELAQPTHQAIYRLGT